MRTSKSEVLAWIGVLRRVQAGGVMNTAGCWSDHSRPLPGDHPDILDQLRLAGLIVLAPGSGTDAGHPASLTKGGQARYTALAQRYGVPVARAELQVPAPEHGNTAGPDHGVVNTLVTTEGPADCRLSVPAPLAPGPASDPALCWARDPDNRRLHALASVDVRCADSRGYAACLCWHKLPAEVVFESGPSGALCVPCVIGAAGDLRALGLLGDT